MTLPGLNVKPSSELSRRQAQALTVAKAQWGMVLMHICVRGLCVYVNGASSRRGIMVRELMLTTLVFAQSRYVEWGPPRGYKPEGCCATRRHSYGIYEEKW